MMVRLRDQRVKILGKLPKKVRKVSKVRKMKGQAGLGLGKMIRKNRLKKMILTLTASQILKSSSYVLKATRFWVS